MKKYVIGIWVIILSILLINGCLTSDYNLRAIKDDRVYMNSDSTSHRMKWHTSSWVNNNVKQWSSAGVIIVDVENVFPAIRTSSDWIKEVVDGGFKGLILIDIDVDNVYTSWGSTPTGVNKTLFLQQWYMYFVMNSIYTKDTSGRAIYDVNNTCRYVDPRVAVNGSALNFCANLVSTYIDTLVARYTIDTDDVKFGVYFDGYDLDAWKPYTDNSVYIESLNADPLQLGRTTANYTAGEMTAFSTYYDAWVDAFYANNVQCVLSGDRFLEDYTANGNLDNSQFTDYSCMGFFFDNVNYSNVDSVITVANQFRTSFTPATTDSSLVFIAGIRNNLYNTFDVTLGEDGTYPNNPKQYGLMINKLIQAGIYFTPGGSNNYWDFPETQPGSWWPRFNDDIIWQNNPNNPTYEIASNPRKFYNIVPLSDPNDTTEVIVPEEPIVFDGSLQATPSFPGGGWLHGGAILHDESIVLVGADVSGVYASQDYGQTFTNWNYGMITSDEVENYYVNDIIAVKNNYFEGALAGTFGGLYKMDVNGLVLGLNVWETMSATTDARYTSTTQTSWGTPWLSSHGWSALDWDDKNCVVAAPGRYRWERSNADHQYAAGTYPEGTTADEDYPNLYGLYKLDYTDEAAGFCKWAQMTATQISTDIGQINDVSMTTSVTDTLVLCASNYGGPYLWNNSSWVDLGDGATWYDYDGNVVTPDWNQDGTVGASGSADAHPQRVVSVFLTSDNVGYCALVNSAWTWDGSSGLYRCPDVTAVSPEWRFVGDNTQYNLWYSDWGNIRDWLIGEQANHPNYTPGASAEYPYICATYISGHEANATTQDTIFVGDRLGRMGYSRVLVDNADKDPHIATWEPKLWLYGNASDTAQPQPPMTEFDYSVPAEWGMQSIFEMVIDPETAQRQTSHTNARIISTTDNWNTLINGFAEQNPTDTDYFRGTGYDETCFNGAVVGSDGSLWYSAGDVGIHTTNGVDWDWIKKNHPLQTFQACYDYSSGAWDGSNRPLTTEFPNTESGGIILLRNFNASGRDAVILTGGDIIQRTLWNNMFMYWDSNGDGTMETTEVTDAIENIDDFKFLGHIHAYDPVNEELFWTYSKYNMSICQNQYRFNLNTNLTTDNITTFNVSQDIATTVANVYGSTLNQQGSIYVTKNDSTTVKLHYSAWSGSTFTIDSTNGDFAATNADIGNKVYIPEEPVQRTGVFKATWNGADWSIADIDSAGIPELTYGQATQGYESLALIDRRLFLAFRGDGASGIYYNDLDGAGTWTQCYGPAFSSLEQDITVMNTDGNKLWFASRGGAGNSSGLFVINTPLSGYPDGGPSGVRGSITRLCNNQNGVDPDYASYSDQVPGILVAENPIAASRYTTDYNANEHIFEPGSILIDPYNTNNVYLLMSGGENDLAFHCGLWYYDASATNGSRFDHRFTDDTSTGLGTNRARMDWSCSPLFDYPRIVYGTHCSGIRWFQVQRPDTNLVYESQDFSLTGWTGETNFTMTTGQTDINGEVTATLFTVNVSTPSNANLITDPMLCQGAEFLTASVYVKQGSTPISDLQRLGLYDETDGVLKAYLYIDFSKGGAPTMSSQSNLVDYTIEAVDGTDWYRVSIVYDRWVGSNNQNSYSVRWQMTDASPHVGGQIYLWGFQLEGNVQSAGNYIHKTGGLEISYLNIDEPIYYTFSDEWLSEVDGTTGSTNYYYDGASGWSTYNGYEGGYDQWIADLAKNDMAVLDQVWLDDGLQAVDSNYRNLTSKVRALNPDFFLSFYTNVSGIPKVWDNSNYAWRYKLYQAMMRTIDPDDGGPITPRPFGILVSPSTGDTLDTQGFAHWHIRKHPDVADTIAWYLLQEFQNSTENKSWNGLYLDFLDWTPSNWMFPDSDPDTHMDVDNDGVAYGSDSDEITLFRSFHTTLLTALQTGFRELYPNGDYHVIANGAGSFGPNGDYYNADLNGGMVERSNVSSSSGGTSWPETEVGWLRWANDLLGSYRPNMLFELEFGVPASTESQTSAETRIENMSGLFYTSEALALIGGSMVQVPSQAYRITNAASGGRGVSSPTKYRNTTTGRLNIDVGKIAGDATITSIDGTYGLLERTRSNGTVAKVIVPIGNTNSTFYPPWGYCIIDAVGDTVSVGGGFLDVY